MVYYKTDQGEMLADGNYSMSLDFDPDTNIFYGDNAQGKTNILEAVYVSGTSRSHRSSKDRELICFSEEEAHICTVFEKKGILHKIDMHLRKNKTKGIAIDGLTGYNRAV